MHNFILDLIFLNQTDILAVFNDETTKVILLKKISTR